MIFLIDSNGALTVLNHYATLPSPFTIYKRLDFECAERKCTLKDLTLFLPVLLEENINEPYYLDRKYPERLFPGGENAITRQR